MLVWRLSSKTRTSTKRKCTEFQRNMEDLNKVSRVWRIQIRMYIVELPYCPILSWQGGILSRGRGPRRRDSWPQTITAKESCRLPNSALGRTTDRCKWILRNWGTGIESLQQILDFWQTSPSIHYPVSSSSSFILHRASSHTEFDVLSPYPCFRLERFDNTDFRVKEFWKNITVRVSKKNS
jgi:hypothetical protein